MTKEEYKELYILITRFKNEVDPEAYGLKNDLTFVIMSIRNMALEKYNLIIYDEYDEEDEDYE